MAYEIINNKRSKSVIRITGNTNTTITLSNLSAGSDETITSAAITGIHTSTDGKWSVYRGDSAAGVLVLELFGENSLQLTQFDVAVSNTKTSNLFFTNSGTGGTLILTVNKEANYSPALTGV